MESIHIHSLLAKEEANILRDSTYLFPKDMTPSTFLSQGIDLEEEQYVVSVVFELLTLSHTDDRSAS